MKQTQFGSLWTLVPPGDIILHYYITLYYIIIYLACEISCNIMSHILFEMQVGP